MFVLGFLPSLGRTKTPSKTAPKKNVFLAQEHAVSAKALRGQWLWSVQGIERLWMDEVRQIRKRQGQKGSWGHIL